MNKSDKDRLIVGGTMLGSIGTIVGHDTLSERKQIQKAKRLDKAVKVGKQAVKMSNLTVRHVNNAKENFNKGIDEIDRQINTGQTQTPAKGANQNNPAKNVRYMGNSANGYKMSDPRTTEDTYKRFVQKQVARHERSFKAVKQLHDIIKRPNSQNYLQSMTAARQNKDAPKPKAANTNYTKKIKSVMQTMGKIVKGSSVLGAISYAASSTPVGDATMDGKKYKYDTSKLPKLKR